MEKQLKHQPKFYIVMKIMFFLSFAVAITFLILFLVVCEKARIQSAGLGDNGYTLLIISIILMVVGALTAFVTGRFAFQPEINRIRNRNLSYLQRDSRGDLEDIETVGAEIQSRAIKTKTRAVMDGVKGDEKCPKCGDKIEAGEEYCNKCGLHLIKVCPKCKSISGPTDDFCKSCGEKL